MQDFLAPLRRPCLVLGDWMVDEQTLCAAPAWANEGQFVPLLTADQQRWRAGGAANVGMTLALLVNWSDRTRLGVLGDCAYDDRGNWLAAKFERRLLGSFAARRYRGLQGDHSGTTCKRRYYVDRHLMFRADFDGPDATQRVWEDGRSWKALLGDALSDLRVLQNPLPPVAALISYGKGFFGDTNAQQAGHETLSSLVADISEYAITLVNPAKHDALWLPSLESRQPIVVQMNLPAARLRGARWRGDDSPTPVNGAFAESVREACRQHFGSVPTVAWVTLGARGSCLVGPAAGQVFHHELPAAPCPDVVGAGDAATAGFLYGLAACARPPAWADFCWAAVCANVVAQCRVRNFDRRQVRPWELRQGLEACRRDVPPTVLAAWPELPRLSALQPCDTSVLGGSSDRSLDG